MLEGFILGTITGICIGYLVYKVKIKYDPEKKTLKIDSILGNLDEQSYENLWAFMEEIIKLGKEKNV